ncbi:MAG: ABC transporter substrate-binding protein [Armatimonadota bacterium]|nr:ABC transporter substrate-binding protein [Armatimonadota bacterium]MDR7452459.1 ABC transporter substrate-binding protein [Armatimonadota bacterium]MDR7466197.1 ABC transporter substrate-binding protein [Armatimonadota bacterium]MDR7495120.1 ABC transporter substrate-binding protein [Armatimonadota bacterium]MDR7500539.1 ABC transporter substrate-binding protein [Armatimonadota bacterium]
MKRFAGAVLVVTALLVLPAQVRSQAPITFTYIEQQIITASDPAAAVDESSLIAAINLYDPLLYPNVEQGSMAPRPHVAESWTISPDGKIYTFKIRRGIKFHSGRELTAADVVFSMDRALRMKKGFSWVWTPVLEPGRVRAIDPYTVRFELKDAYAPFLGSLLLFFILDKDLVMSNLRPGPYGEFGDYGVAFLERADAGSGPYRMERFDRATEMVMTRFDAYWRGWKPNQISRVSFKTVTEEATVKTLLLSGQADMVNQWLTVQGFRELRQASGIVVKEDPSVQLFHLEMNTKKPPLDNLKVRQAIAYAFDYDTAIQQIFEGATKARGPVPVRVPGWNPNVPVYSRNTTKAKQLLAESGVPASALAVEYAYVVTLPLERQIGLLLKNNLEAIGFKVEIRGEPWARIVELATKAETTPHITAIFDTLKYPHVDSHTYGMYHPSCWGTFRCMSFYENPKVTQVLEAARRATKPEEQMRLYQQAQALIVADAPSIYVANPLHRIAFRNYVKGYRYVGLLGFDVAYYDFTIVR